MTRLKIHLERASANWNGAFKKMDDKIECAAALAFARAKKPAAFRRRDFEINIILTGDRQIKTLNRDYRGFDKPTNVLSFPQFDVRKFDRSMLAHFPAANPVPLGDVVLAWQTVKRESREQRKHLENHALHLIVHGTLHLLGYDHMKPGEAKTMEKLECDILESLGYPDPYHEIQP